MHYGEQSNMLPKLNVKNMQIFTCPDLSDPGKPQYRIGSCRSWYSHFLNGGTPNNLARNGFPSGTYWPALPCFIHKTCNYKQHRTCFKTKHERAVYRPWVIDCASYRIYVNRVTQLFKNDPVFFVVRLQLDDKGHYSFMYRQ